MRTILHILTRTEDSLSRELIERQRALGDINVEVVNLADLAPDYDALVERIFAADSVEVF